MRSSATIALINGNRLRFTRRNAPSDPSPALTAISAIQSGTNRLASVNDGAVRSFSYDGRGNIVAETRPGGVTVTNDYDGFGRLVSAARTGEATWTMLYNGLGDRVQVTAGSNVRRFVYDERGRLLGEYGTSASDVAAEHVWLDPDEGHEPLALIGTTTISWVHGDHLGTPAMVTDASGNIANRYQAWPFGQRTQQLAAPTTAMSFPGQVIDTPDRHYNRARDYDPTLGRYLQADPIGLDGGDNLFAYVNNMPTTYIDPEGEFGIPGAIVGAGVDIAIQLALNGGNVRCIDPGSVLVSAALGAAGGWGVSLRRGGEFSHWIPKRYFRPGRLPRWLDGPWNGSRVSNWRHYKHDPYRYSRVKGEWESWGKRWPRWIQQIDRIPDWMKISGGAGGTNAAGGCHECK